MKAISLAESLVLKSKAPVRKKYSKIDYKDACGDEVSLEHLSLLYGVCEKTITRAFAEYSGDYKAANYDLIERNLVPDSLLQSGDYMRKVYRDQEGNQVSRKECAGIMGLSPDHVRLLYWKHKSNYKYIYANFGKTKIANLAERKAKALA